MAGPSTLALVTDNLYVYVAQFNLVFPSQVSELSSFLDTLQTLSTVIMIMEQTSQEMKNAMDYVDRSHAYFTNHMLSLIKLLKVAFQPTKAHPKEIIGTLFYRNM